MRHSRPIGAWKWLPTLAAAHVALTWSTAAFTQEFTAKSVQVVVGFAPGGGYDTHARVLARHYGRHLPGNPSVVVQNLPGGGSLNLANATYNTAPADGSYIALINSAAALEPVLGNALAKFETTKFVWIGNMINDAVGCAAWHTSGIKTWDDAIRLKAKFGGVSAAGTSSQHAFFLRNVLGATIDVITGYRGTNEINLGMQRGEVDASCGLSGSSVRGPYRKDYEEGNLRMIIQFGKQNEPYFKDAVNVYSFIKNEDDRQLTEFIFGQVELSRPVVASPSTPAPIAAALRNAFDKTMLDPLFLAEAQKAQLDIQPINGVETAKLFARFASVSPTIAQRAKVAMQSHSEPK